MRKRAKCISILFFSPCFCMANILKNRTCDTFENCSSWKFLLKFPPISIPPTDQWEFRRENWDKERRGFFACLSTSQQNHDKMREKQNKTTNEANKTKQNKMVQMKQKQNNMRLRWKCLKTIENCNHSVSVRNVKLKSDPRRLFSVSVDQSEATLTSGSI